jgi:hypothetical protein
MHTKCYCIYCPKHPLHLKQKEFKNGALTGWSVDCWIDSDYEETASEVECLNPISAAFSELDIYPKDFEFPITAYGDGNAVTGVEGNGFNIYAICKDETYKEI